MRRHKWCYTGIVKLSPIPAQPVEYQPFMQAISAQPMPEPPTSHILIAATTLFDGETFRSDTCVEIEAGRIVALHPANRAPALPRITLHPGTTLAPGFIDIQVNGGGDVLLNDAPSVDSVRAIAAAHRRFGTTGLLPTLITDSPEKLAALRACAEAAMAVPGVLGFHLEGPFFNLDRKGVHPPEFIRAPSESDLVTFRDFGRIGHSLVTLAPECVSPSCIMELVAAGLRIAIAHSEATAEEVEQAISLGVTGVTHLFNAMSQLQPRAPGIVGTALADDRLMAGIIADGLHVDPRALRIAFRAMGADRLCLVTDAMPTAGGVSSAFQINGRPVTLRDGRLLDESGTLAGAHLTMIEAVRNAVTMMGASLGEALIMASRSPAHFLGLEDELGKISPGYRVNLVAFDADRVCATWIDGVIAEH